jgi:predicted alpha/beta hydrolase family esterase
MNVIVIHGSFGKPFENWFPWLENKLSETDKVECIIPTFPTPEKQEFVCWEELLNYYHKIGKIDKNSIIIGHSCGSVFAAKYLTKHNIKVKALITVAGYNNFLGGDALMDSLNNSFYDEDKALSSIVNFAPIRISFISDNDPFIPSEVLNHFVEVIQSEKLLIPNGGHFNSNAGFSKFVELYEEVHKILK